MLNKSKSPAGYRHGPLKALIITTVTIPWSPPGFQGHKQKKPRNQQLLRRSLTAMTTHSQHDGRAGWERAPEAPVKHSLLHRPGLEEEVGEKGQGGGRHLHASTGG